MNKAQKANVPAFANLHGEWSNINTSIFYWKVFQNEGFVFGDLSFVGVFNKRIGMVLLEMKERTFDIIKREKINLQQKNRFKKNTKCILFTPELAVKGCKCIHIYKLPAMLWRHCKLETDCIKGTVKIRTA